jgi:hypothetical protein
MFRRLIVLIIIVLMIILGYLTFFREKTEYPVKVGQTWKNRSTVIPFYHNRPLNEIDVVRYYKVTYIDEENNMIYFTCNSNEFELPLQCFLHESRLEKK